MVRIKGSHRQYKHHNKKGVVTIADRDIDPFVVAGIGNFFPSRGYGNRLP
jgi:predicted RNA binding protein YcfA (HicA-like mRNA interferase family)